MSDVLCKVIYFDQHLVFKKSLYEKVSHDELSVVFRTNENVLCHPYIYFRPINVTDVIKEYEFTELIFECYEGHAHVVSQSVEESGDEVHIVTRYFMPHDDELGSLRGNKFIYQTDDYTFEYQIENSLVPLDRICTPLNPLGLSIEGTLKCWVVEEPLDTYLSLYR
ncbi:hypothetical protein J8Z24_11865 [Pseudoalteromonas sp. SCSIO 43201]|uniref:hypothetical protein n=1 Tax=Pseudoalteromonas sp. SCSIO 43201 TaxID=2822842 RepID=UPI002074BB3D|nr:hypothetical protein [Pseudoalteromonas sp. SCSIO 43201]USD27646.1 hypothetical protein J8Z24_11865 [Pseudoalteromonas sp. SCSIO 43201]